MSDNILISLVMLVSTICAYCLGRLDGYNRREDEEERG